MIGHLTGMHHVSALSADIVETHRFWTRVLGMRLVLRTVNQDEPTMYHLFFGDGAGSVGSDFTVFDLPQAARERPGNHSISRTTLRVSGAGSLEFWASRLDEAGVVRGAIEEWNGRAALPFEDPQETRLALVDDGGTGAAAPWDRSPVPPEHQVRGLGYNVVTVPDLAPTDRFLTEGLGLEPSHGYAAPGDGEHRTHVYRMRGAGPQAELHVLVRRDLPRARYGAGGVHHLAVRVPDDQEPAAWAEHLAGLGYANSGVVDRHYFRSVYVREPNGILVELATDGPGFEVDGPIDGDRLRLPPPLEPRRAEVEARLRPIG